MQQRVETSFRSHAADAYAASQQRLAELPNRQALFDLAARIRQHTLDHLDAYLDQFQKQVEARGGHVHFAADAAEARQIILDIATQNRCRRVTHSAGPILSEIALTDALQQAGLGIVSSDTAADLAITASSFLVAETGQLCTADDQSASPRCIALPRVLVAVGGIEQIIPRLADLSVFLKLFARARDGHRMTTSTTIFGGAPPNFHVILLDNARTQILSGNYRGVLRCVHCQACLIVCPVHRSIGPQATTYTGPIGAVLSPLLFGLDRYRDLPSACTLCGACSDACPVKIDLPDHLLRLRVQSVSAHLNPRSERRLFRRWAWLFSSPLLYRLSAWFRRRSLRRRADEDGWVSNSDGTPLPPWTSVCHLPAPAEKSFHQLWKDRARARR